MFGKMLKHMVVNMFAVKVHPTGVQFVSCNNVSQKVTPSYLCADFGSLSANIMTQIKISATKYRLFINYLTRRYLLLHNIDNRKSVAWVQSQSGLAKRRNT